MKQAWSRKPERVCVLEDDTVIHPQAFEWLVGKEGNVNLTPEEIAGPWCISTKEWSKIEPKSFCEHDDYNWNQTITWMKRYGLSETRMPSKSLSMRVGDCGGWDASDNRQIGWSFMFVGTAGGDSRSYFLPDHVVVRDLWVQNFGTDPMNYLIRVERQRLSDDQAILALIQERAQDDI